MDNSFTYRLGSSTTTLGRPPKFYDNSALHNAGCRFASVYAIRHQDSVLIEEAGTAAGFRGQVWSQRLWIDCDTTEASKDVYKFLKAEGYDFTAYETGNRGMHFGVLRHTSPSHLLPIQDKAWVKENIQGADLSLYWHLHLIRLPGTIHEKTGKPKKFVEHIEGKALVLPKYEEEFSKTNAVSDYSALKSIFNSWGVLSRLTPNPGVSRHKHLLTLATALNKAKSTLDGTKFILLEVNKTFDEPKSEIEIDNILNWVYSNNYKETI